MIKQVSYQHIKQNRNNPRLWLEGLKLSTSGFVKGARYSIIINAQDITIRLDHEGRYTTSGKIRNGREIPIIDLGRKELSDKFGIENRVRVIFHAETITITLHHEDRAKSERETRLRNSFLAGTMTEASLFTGGGISTHAIHSAIVDHGHQAKLSWVVDSELKYLQVGYQNNFAITDETSAFIGRAEEIEPNFYSNVDILSFSMPCTGFSIAGKSKHGKSPEAHDSATSLFGTINAIRAANPAIIISENVLQAQNSAAYALLRAEIQRLGYKIFERVMDQSDTGSIENRRRYWFVALSEGISDNFDFTTVHELARSQRPCLNDIIEDCIPETMWCDNIYLKEKQKRDLAAGKGFANRQLLSGEETSIGVVNRTYHKKQSTGAFLTRDDGKERLFTSREHARVKSVPEELIANTSNTNAHEILGQSVDWRQAWLVMHCIMNQLINIFEKSQNLSFNLSDLKTNPSQPRQLSFDQLFA